MLALPPPRPNCAPAAAAVRSAIAARATAGSFTLRSLQDVAEAFRGTRQDGARALLDDRPLDQVRMLDHQIDDLGVGQLARTEPQRLVDALVRAQQLARGDAHLAQQLLELRLRD